MFLYGTNAAVSIVDVERTAIYNITSLREDLPVLYIVPPKDLGYLSDYDFDVAYYNYVLNNDQIFLQFFQIVMNLYMGHDVLLVFSDDNWSENLAESILKMIQQRYGYNGAYIESMQDYIDASLTLEFKFEPYLLYNLDEDKKRFAYLSESIRLQNGGKPCMEEDEY